MESEATSGSFAMLEHWIQQGEDNVWGDKVDATTMMLNRSAWWEVLAAAVAAARGKDRGRAGSVSCCGSKGEEEGKKKEGEEKEGGEGGRSVVEKWWCFWRH
jgi:hypothetical protein